MKKYLCISLLFIFILPYSSFAAPPATYAGFDAVKQEFTLLGRFIKKMQQSSRSSVNKIINVKDRGAKGNGIADDWEVIQRAVDELANAGGGKLYFPRGTYAIYGKSVVIWGKNITLEGESSSNTTIVKKGIVGFFGDCIDIAGKINNYQYYGGFGHDSYKIIRFYRGPHEKTENIVLRNLTIDSKLSDRTEKRKIANNLGILNSRNVLIENCIIQNAPQTNVAMVNDTKHCTNINVRFVNCVFRNSGQHNVRVISYNKGAQQGNQASFKNCKFLNVIGADMSQKEIRGQKVLLWYRGSLGSGTSYVKLTDCYFDASGIIYTNGNVNGLSIVNSEVKSSLCIQHNLGVEPHPNIVIRNTTFAKKGFAPTFRRAKMQLNVVRKLRHGFRDTPYGVVYPGTLEINVEN